MKKLRQLLTLSLLIALISGTLSGCSYPYYLPSGFQLPQVTGNEAAAPAQAADEGAPSQSDAAGEETNAQSHAEAEVDYSNSDNWAYFGIGDNKDADLFLICPTVDTKSEYNMPLSNDKVKEKFVGALNMERGIYENSTRMYSPFYRQAAMGVYSLPLSEQEQYLSLAYRDVSAAFAYYLEHENNDRPIILAGFSQGADMCYRLLEEYFDDTELAERLVAVYAIGWPFTEEMVKEYPQIVPAKGETDTGVVISFDCEAPEVSETFILPADVKSISINPLNWRTDGEAADKSENLGACFTNYGGEITREEAGLCGCYIDEERGSLKVTDVSPSEYKPALELLPSGAYHIYDYQFFYRNLEKNVSDRLNAYLSSLS